MNVNEKMKKALSILLCLCMLLQNCPVVALAAHDDNLCEHHTEHTAECGYVEGSAGSACTHEQSEDCYAILDCKHTCGDECAEGCTHECAVENGCVRLELDCRHVHGDCGYSEGTAEVPCGHVHNESCGYAEAVAGNPCANAETDPECDHSGDCGFVAAVEGQPCKHTACDDTCGYAPATEGTPCTHVCEVKVDSDDSCYKLLCSHKDGGHDDVCGYAEAVEAHECHYECAEEDMSSRTSPQTGVAIPQGDAGSEEIATSAPDGDLLAMTEKVCDCGTDDALIHAVSCAVYVAPENPQCFCAEKCSDTNIWCDVCGFDVTGCTGTDTAAAYADDLTLQDADGDCYYEISTADELYAFAAAVNSGNTTINAILTTDIVVNENVLNADGTLNDGTFRTWTPIGSSANPYTGTFDGNGKTISGLYYNNAEVMEVGLVSRAGKGSVVKNVSIVDSYFCADMFLGSIVGYNLGTVINCSNAGLLHGRSLIGGIVGGNIGTIRDCRNAGNVSGEENYIGGISADIGNEGGIIQNCHNTGNISANYGAGGVLGESAASAQDGIIENCSNTGSVSVIDEKAGGIVSNVINGETTINNCYNTGDVSGGSDVGGIVGVLYSNTDTLKNSYNTGNISCTIKVSGDPIVGANDGIVTNCYYLSETEEDGGGKTAEQFASGEVTFLLNGSTYDGVWKQTLGTDLYPQFTGGTVYQVTACNSQSVIYSNSTAQNHNYENGICSACGNSCPHTQEPTYTVAAVSHEEFYPCCKLKNSGDHTPDAANKCTACGAMIVLKQNDQYYADGYAMTALQNGDEGTLTLLADVTLKEAEFGDSACVSAGTACVLDLNGHKLSLPSGKYIAVNEGSDLTIQDNSEVGSGTLSGSGVENGLVYNSGTLSIINGTVSAGESCAVYNEGTVCITGAPALSSTDCVFDYHGGTIDLSGVTGLEESGWRVCAGGNVLKVTLSGEGLILPDAVMLFDADNKYTTSLPSSEYGTIKPHEHSFETNTDGSYHCSACGYGCSHDSYINGFCVGCDAYLKPAAGDGTAEDPYQIANAGNLYWLADKVNNDNANFGSANAILTANIVDNENVLDANGDLNGTAASFRHWTPMGFYRNTEYGSVDTPYSGIFNGNGKTISGLYIPDYEAPNTHGNAFIGCLNGTVKELGLLDSYVISDDSAGGIVDGNQGTISGCYNAATICGMNHAGGIASGSTGKIEDCRNTGKILGEYTVGGIVGQAADGAVVENCHNTGLVGGSVGNSSVGGIVGGMHTWDETLSPVVRNCYNTGAVTGRETIGGIVGWFTAGTVTDCYNLGLISGNAETGGVTGNVSNGTTTNCYYLNTCGAAGSGIAKTEEDFASGEVAYLLQGDQTTQVWGQNIDNGYSKEGRPVFSNARVYCGYTSCDEEKAAIYTNDASISQDRIGHSFGEYTVAGDKHSRACSACGKVETETHSTTAEDDRAATCTAPAYCSVCVGEYGDVDKTNHDESMASTEYTNGFCPNCDGYQPAELVGTSYQITNAGQLYWFAQQVNSGSTAINGELKADIVVNENVLTADGTLNGDGSNFRAWTPIGNEANAYTGEFRGSEHTVSGLYVNGSADYVGLFGYVGSGGTVQNVGVIDSYLDGSRYVGGVAGLNKGTLQYVYNTGNVNGSNYAGGVVGRNNYIVRYAYNTGTVFANNNAGGVVGENNYILEYAYNTGFASNMFQYGSVTGSNRDAQMLKNCYYLADSETDSFDGTTAKTAEQFASGEVAYLLSQGEKGDIWGQDLDNGKTKQTAPTFTGAKVYCGYTSCGDAGKIYTNNEAAAEKPAHTGTATYTLTEDGTKHIATYDCCGTTVTEDHTYGELIEAQPAVHIQTELKAAVAAHYFCDVCDTYFTETKTATTLEELTGKAPEHSYGNWITTDDAKHWKECSCGLKTEGSTHVYDDEQDAECNTCGHNRTVHICGNGTLEKGQAATCTVDGWKDYYKCFCNKLYEDQDCESLISDLESWKAGAGKIAAAHTPGTAVEENRKESTCTVAGSYDEVVYCSVCKTHEMSREKKELALANHTPGTPVEENRVESTCTVAGSYNEVVYCSVCKTHEMSREKKELALTDHTPGTPVEENRVESTCTVAGSYDEVVYCSVCKTHEMSREKKELALANHTPGTAVEENRVESTCTVAGSYDEVVYCSVCKTHEMSREKKELALANHTPGTPVEENRVESTCTEAGSYDEVVYCSVCKTHEISREKKELALANHTPGTPVEENRVESTCTAAGSYDEVVYCSVCKTHEISREKKELTLANHTPGTPVEENRVESTCTEAGSYDEVVYCSVCKTHEISRTEKELALAEHTPGTAVEENRVESTCTAAGSYDEVVYCSVCKTHEISRETKTLELADHSEEVVKGYDPTCTESGLTDGIKCGICGEVLTQQEEIPALGHNVVMKESEEPSCDLNGYEYYACERCDGQEYTILLEATGHDYEDGKCTKCGEEDPDAAKPNKPGYGFIWDWIFGGWWDDGCKHSYTSEVTAPTCTEKGYTTHTCSECGDSYKDSYTNALGHTWDDGVVTKEPACTEKGEKAYTCSVCGAKKTESIKAIGHKFEDGVCTECGEEEASKPIGPSEPDKPCKPGWGNIWDLIFKWWK